jgi:predicted HTH transcriptional regulator
MKDKALRMENAELKKTIASLKEEIVLLKQKIAILQQKGIDSQPTFHPNKLPDDAEKILIFLSEHRYVTSKQVSHYLALDYRKTEYWLKELVKERIINASISIGAPTKYSISQGGREYLTDNDMI